MRKEEDRAACDKHRLSYTTIIFLVSKIGLALGVIVTINSKYGLMMDNKDII